MQKEGLEQRKRLGYRNVFGQRVSWSSEEQTAKGDRDVHLIGNYTNSHCVCGIGCSH